jgi:hypothetical protein
MTSHFKKSDVHLKGRVTQEPEELYLRVYCGGHEVYDCNLEGAYILMFRPVSGYDKNPLFPKGVISG